jgi:ABC-type lipoprotein export system ATPase subunit
MGIQEKLIISNFLSIKDFEWDIKDFNILTGGMASGKSICIKVVHFIEQIFHRNIFLSSISKDTLTKDNFYKRLSDQFNTVFYSSAPDKDFINTKIEYSYSVTDGDGNSRMTFDLIGSWNKTDGKIEWNSNYINDKIDTWRDFLGTEHTPDSAKNARLQIHESMAHDFNNNFPLGVLFIPASRAIAAIINKNIIDIPDTYLGDFIGEYKSFVLNFDNLSDNDVNKILHLSKILIESEQDKDKTLRFELSNGMIITPLELSSGQQELLYLLLLIKNLPRTSFRYGKTTSIFIEEPSAHLFPQEQKESIDYIVKIFKKLQKNKERFFITTHSPYILNTVNNMLKKGSLLKAYKGYKEYEEQINKKIGSPHLYCEEVSAYFINADGTVTDMLDKEANYLNADKIAEISFAINEDTNKLIELNNFLLQTAGISIE